MNLDLSNHSANTVLHIVLELPYDLDHYFAMFERPIVVDWGVRRLLTASGKSLPDGAYGSNWVYKFILHTSL